MQATSKDKKNKTHKKSKSQNSYNAIPALEIDYNDASQLADYVQVKDKKAQKYIG
jgi:hypothetical protein